MSKLDDYIGVRLPVESKSTFNQMCEDYGVAPQDMLREMIDAFNSKNLRIIVPKTQLKILRGIHDVA